MIEFLRKSFLCSQFLFLAAAPYWVMGPPPNKRTSEGEDVIFDCSAYGKPAPVVSFFKNGVG